MEKRNIWLTEDLNGSLPKWMFRLCPMKLSNSPAMQYAAIEFMPMTRSGKAQKRTPSRSSTA